MHAYPKERYIDSPYDTYF